MHDVICNLKCNGTSFNRPVKMLDGTLVSFKQEKCIERVFEVLSSIMRCLVSSV